MIRPNLYKETNNLPKNITKGLIKEFKNLLEPTWNDNGQNALLDIGSGPGDVLVDIIMPIVPQKTEVIGVDISKEMVNSSKENYAAKKNLNFLQFDVGSEIVDEKNTVLTPNSFNLITSTFTFHWILNQRLALSNIYKLLKPNGTCMITFFVTLPIFDVYTHLSKMKKYSSYMTDVDNFISPYHYEDEPLEVFKSLITDVGFKVSHLEIRREKFFDDNLKNLEDGIRSVNPFLTRLPEHLRNEFIADEMRKFEDFSIIRLNEKTMQKYAYTPFKLMIAILNK